MDRVDWMDVMDRVDRFMQSILSTQSTSSIQSTLSTKPPSYLAYPIRAPERCTATLAPSQTSFLQKPFLEDVAASKKTALITILTIVRDADAFFAFT